MLLIVSLLFSLAIIAELIKLYNTLSKMEKEDKLSAVKAHSIANENAS